MQKPVHTKYFILIPTVLNIALFYMLVQPIQWVQMTISPAWQAVLMCCGVAMTGVMALAYVRLHDELDRQESMDQAHEQTTQAAPSMKTDAPAKDAAAGGVYEAAEATEEANA